RFVVQESLELAGLRLGKGIATVIVLVVGMGLAFGAGADGSGGMVIWPLFGTTNQLLAGLTLSIVAVILLRKRRPVLPVLLPLVFVMAMSLFAAIVQVRTFYTSENWLLLVLDLVIIVAAIWVILEATIAMTKARKSPPETDDESAAVETS